MLADDLRGFFNPDEFAVTALIQNSKVLGILELSLSTVHQVQCHQFKFICAEAAMTKVKREDEIKIADQSYRIVDIKPDGTGLVTLLLEAMQ